MTTTSAKDRKASDKERKAKSRANREAEGFSGHEVWVHNDDWPQVKTYINRLNKQRRSK